MRRRSSPVTAGGDPDAAGSVPGRCASWRSGSAGMTPRCPPTSTTWTGLPRTWPRIRAALPARSRFCYAVKANPDPAVLRAVARHADGLEVSSGGELRHAAGGGARRQAGVRRPGQDAGRTGRRGPRRDVPVPRGEPARAALLGCGRPGRGPCRPTSCSGSTCRGGRAPGFGLGRRGKHLVMGGTPDSVRHGSGFAGSLRGVARRRRPRSPGYCGCAGFTRTWPAGWTPPRCSARRCACSASRRQWCARHGVRRPGVQPRRGNGRGLPPAGPPVRLGTVRARAWPGPARPGETLRIEPGRAVTAYCGWYVTRVLDVKRSHGKAFAVVAGGTHHLRTPAAKGHDQPFAVISRPAWPHDWPRPGVGGRAGDDRRPAVHAQGRAGARMSR